MIRVIVVDDEPLARSRLRNLLQAHSEVELIAECEDGFEAVKAIRTLNPDLVFLDVQMPEKDGFQVIEEIGLGRMPPVIFVTAYDQYALNAFHVHALDYLLKPFDEDRFTATLGRAVQIVEQGRPAQQMVDVLRMLEEWKSGSKYLTRILVRDRERMSFLEASQIEWIQAEGNYIRIYSMGQSYTLRETIQNIETQLNPAEFLRIHRSTIVRLDRIKEMRTLFHGAGIVELADGTKLRLSRRYRNQLPPAAEKG